MEPFAVGAAIGLAILLLTSKKSDGADSPAKLPDPELKDLVTVTEWKPVPGGMARYYRKNFIPSIAINLQYCGVVKVYEAIYRGSLVRVFKLTDTVPAGQTTAAAIAKMGYEGGSAVLVTANFWIKSGGAAYLAVIPYEQRAEWTNNGRQWAIEFDNQAGEDTPGTVTTIPGKKFDNTYPGTSSADDFDSNMTAAEKEASAAFLLRTDLDAAFYEQQAIAAETPGHAGTSHGGHPKCAALFRKRGAELAKKAGPVKVIPKKDAPKDWGTPEGGPPEATFDTLLVNGYPYKDITVQRHEVQALNQGDGILIPGMVALWESPASIASAYTDDWRRYREIMPINPGLKQSIPYDPNSEFAPAGPSTGVTPWPPKSGFIWVPANWMDSRLKIPSSLPAGCAPDASKPPPWGETT